MITRCFGLIIAVGLVWSPPAADASTVFFAATLDGAQETPPNGSAGTGTATLFMDTDANALIGAMGFSGLGSAETMAHIHGFAPPGVPADVLVELPLGSPKPVIWNFDEADQTNIVAGLTYFNVHTVAFPGGEIRGQILRVPTCSDGVLDGGEDCDDGNHVDGDCCSATCKFEPAGTPCPPDGGPCTTSACDGAGSCGAVQPRNGCRAAQKSALALSRNPDDDGRDKLRWRWLKGDQTTQADFGAPTGTTSHTLCLYAGTTATFIGSATIPPGASWSAISDKGYKFKDASGTPEGVQKAVLKGGAPGRAKAIVNGKGTNLPDVLGAALPLPVTAQLVNDANATCFEGQYDSADVIKNDGARFKAKAQ